MSLDRIVSAAMQLVDREGLTELSMRRLATELGTGTTTLYRYVTSKEEVLVLVADAIFAEVTYEVPSTGVGWRELLGDLARSMRATMAEHPGVATLFTLAVPIGPNSLRARDVILGALRDRGFDRGLAADVYTTVAHQVLASVMQQQMIDYRGGQAISLRDFYRSLPVDEYPHVVELADELTSKTTEEEFEFALQCLFDGVEIRLAATNAGRGRPEANPGRGRVRTKTSK